MAINKLSTRHGIVNYHFQTDGCHHHIIYIHAYYRYLKLSIISMDWHKSIFQGGQCLGLTWQKMFFLTRYQYSCRNNYYASLRASILLSYLQAMVTLLMKKFNLQYKDSIAFHLEKRYPGSDQAFIRVLFLLLLFFVINHNFIERAG